MHSRNFANYRIARLRYSPVRPQPLCGKRKRPANELQTGRKEKGSAEGRNRTGDTMIFSHVLYQLSYLGAGDLFYRQGRLLQSPKERSRDPLRVPGRQRFARRA